MGNCRNQELTARKSGLRKEASITKESLGAGLIKEIETLLKSLPEAEETEVSSELFLHLHLPWVLLPGLIQLEVAA